jgi:tRNA(His) guanylyltransferase
MGSGQMFKDDFGDRMKSYESVYTSQKVDSNQFLCVRIDGKRFSRYTKGFEKPFDPVLTDLFRDVTQIIMEKTDAWIGYTQSDEVTLVYKLGDKATEYIFGGKTSKINSILASMFTANFNYLFQTRYPSFFANKGLALFDCRSWSVPSYDEVVNTILWRVQDCKRNSVSSLMRHTCGHKRMQNLSVSQMIDVMQMEADVDWWDLNADWSHGILLAKVYETSEINDEVWKKIPDSKKPETRMMTRGFIRQIEWGDRSSLEKNEKEVIKEIMNNGK